jgi:DNA repair ATPase RecN
MRNWQEILDAKRPRVATNLMHALARCRDAEERFGKARAAAREAALDLQEATQDLEEAHRELAFDIEHLNGWASKQRESV